MFNLKLKQRFKKLCNFSIVTMIMLNTFSPTSFASIVKADVDPLAGFKVTDAFVYLNGKEIDTVPSKINQNQNIELEYHWSIADTDFVNEGDSISIPLPDALNLGNSNVTGNLYGSVGELYGSWELDVTSRELQLTLSNVPTGESNVHGTVKFNLDFRVDQMVVSVPYQMKIPISDSIEKTYTINFKVPGTSLDKSGIQSSNPNTIIWTIDLNRSLDTISNPTVIDTMDPLLDFNNTSFKIYPLFMKSDGSSIEDTNPIDSSLYDLNYDRDTKILTITFIHTINSAYRIVYDTTINPDLIDTSKTTFNYVNNVRFNGQTDSATVNVTRKPLVVKNNSLSQNYNADQITWKININQSLYDLTNVSIEDTLPSGLTLDTNSIKLYTMPNKVLVDPSLYTVQNDTSRIFTVDLGDIDQEYLLEYNTLIDDSAKDNNTTSISFTNTAKLTQGVTSNRVSTTVTNKATVNKGQVLKKNGVASISYNDNKTILWTLDVNLAEIGLNSTYITDVIDSTHKLDSTYNLQVYPIVIDHSKSSNNISLGNPLIKDVDYIITNVGTNEFKIEFPTAITTAYRIVYQTVITDKKTQSFKNTAYIGDVTSSQKVTSSVTPTIANTYSKSSTSINYQTNELTWNITFNPIQQAINNLVITDTLSAGLMMTDAQINQLVIKKGNTPLVLDTDYTITKTMLNNKIKGFIISFKDMNYVVNDDVYSIIYKTSIDIDQLSNNGNLDYSNSVNFTSDLGTTTKTSVPSVNTTGLHNGYKVGTLDTVHKKIDWKIYTNYLSKNIDHLVVTDAMIGNQKLDANSIEIYHYTVNSAGMIILGNKVDLNAEGFNIITQTDGTSFTITYPDLITTPYLIQYSTDFVGISQTQYSNIAITNKGENYSASVNYADGDKFVEKTGTRNGVQSIDWQIILNKSQSTIDNFVLTDDQSEGLELDSSSFVVTKLDNTIVDFDSLFTLVILPRTLSTDPQSFELRSKQTINETYIIKYRSNIILDNVLENKVTNHVSFNGEQVVSGTVDSIKTISYTFVTGSGTGVGEVGSFTVTKVDEFSNPLEGATFELYKNGNLIGQVETDSQGQISLTRLKYATYTLKEINAPTGYQIVNPTTNIVINSTTNKNITIQNDILRSLEIVKVDQDQSDIMLENATFEIRDLNNVVISTITTNEFGKASILLPYGTYYVQETIPPTGYQLNDKIFTIDIQKGDLNADLTPKLTYSLTISNEQIPKPRTLTIYKVDQEDSSLKLGGATFEIRDTENKLIDTVTTNSLGFIAIELPIGSYSIQEIIPPKGYQLSDQIFTVNIQNDDLNEDLTKKLNYSLTIQNKKIPLRKLYIYKVDRNNPNLYLANTTFEIRNQYNHLLYTVTTNEDGFAMVELPFGIYYVTEIIPPTGYLLDYPTQEITISENDLNESNNPKLVYSIIANNSKIVPPSNIEKLPQTGEGLPWFYWILGTLFIVFGAYFILSKNNNEKIS